MTTTSKKLVTEISELKSSILKASRAQAECRNNRDYNKYRDEMLGLKRDMKIKAQELVDSLTTSIELEEYLMY